MALELPQRKSDLEEELLRSQKEHEALEAKLKKIKEDIARREKEAEELQKKADAAGLGSISTGDHDKKDESEIGTAKEDKSESSSS
jgi:predicted  nucleic acid-binding Zn-ribbon protein